MSNKFVYVFGASKTEGSADMKNLLGGKGANLAEMCRLGLAMGARYETFLGLAGVGDLTLTSTSELSRNFKFGKIWGETLSRKEPFNKMAGKVIEGFATAEVLKTLAENFQIRMPICQNVYELLYTDKPLQEITASLLSHQSDLEF